MFTPIIPAGERTPAQRAHLFGTVMTGQTEMRIHIFRGTSNKVEENHSLGWFSIDGISPGPAVSDKVALVLKVGDDAIIGAAFETETRRALPFAAAGPPSQP
jgi:molecular chaperone DnaK